MINFRFSCLKVDVILSQAVKRSLIKFRKKLEGKLLKACKKPVYIFENYVVGLFIKDVTLTVKDEVNLEIIFLISKIL